jgi:DNA-binding XRE family transcriptional regulator
MAGIGLGERVKAARLGRGMTMAELAAACGLTKGFISQVESGSSNPSLNTLRNIAAALQIPVSALLAGAGPSFLSVAAPIGQDGPTVLHDASGPSVQPGIVSLAGGPAGVHALVTLAHGDRVVHSPGGDAPEAHTEAILSVLEGRATLIQSTNSVELSRGVVASFDADISYTIEASSFASLLLFVPQGSALPRHEAAKPIRRVPRPERRVSPAPILLGLKQGRRTASPRVMPQSRALNITANRSEGPLRLVAMRAQRLAERRRES